MRGDAPGLPPLIVRGVDDVEDVSVPEAETLAGETAVLCPLVVEQRPVESKRHQDYVIRSCEVFSNSVTGSERTVTVGPRGFAIIRNIHRSQTCFYVCVFSLYISQWKMEETSGTERTALSFI